MFLGIKNREIITVNRTLLLNLGRPYNNVFK
jgi:hypothetical protein